MLEGECHLDAGGCHLAAISMLPSCWKEDAILMLEGGRHLEEEEREQMDKDVEDLLAVGDEFRNRRSLVHLLDPPFQPNEAPPTINNRTIMSLI